MTDPTSPSMVVAAAAAEAPKAVKSRIRLPKIKYVFQRNGVQHTTFPFLQEASHVDTELLELLKEHRPYAKANKTQRGVDGTKGTSWKAFVDICHQHVDHNGQQCLQGIAHSTIMDRMTSYKTVVATLEDPKNLAKEVSDSTVWSDGAKKLRHLLKVVVIDIITSENKRVKVEERIVFHDGPPPMDAPNHIWCSASHPAGPYSDRNFSIVKVKNPSAAAAASAAARAVLVTDPLYPKQEEPPHETDDDDDDDDSVADNVTLFGLTAKSKTMAFKAEVHIDGAPIRHAGDKTPISAPRQHNELAISSHFKGHHRATGNLKDDGALQENSHPQHRNEHRASPTSTTDGKDSHEEPKKRRRTTKAELRDIVVGKAKP